MKRKQPKRKKKSAPALTPQQARFVEEYAVDANATQAAIRAGYSRHSAEQQGHRLLRHAGVIRALDTAAAVRGEAAEAATAKWLEETQLIAHSDIGDVFDFSGPELRMRDANKIPTRTRRAISAIKIKRYVEGKGEDARTVEIVEFKFWSKDAALERLARWLKIAPEQHEVTGKDGKPIQHAHQYVAEWGAPVPVDGEGGGG